ncbi:MAG: phytanoyl-CoA dioxygenase family protein [Pirellulaceae bacterium]|nr:phytanoyl-CoA dioxygenase family protein [Pirellulaceae bacterium]
MDVYTELEDYGYAMLSEAFDGGCIKRMQTILDRQIRTDSEGTLAQSESGQVYAARNILSTAPELKSVLEMPVVQRVVRQVLGPDAGLVRALFFDKPPEQSWSLPWHKDQSIAVAGHGTLPPGYSRPTVKRGVPHLIAPDALLQEMITLRIHLDAMTDENGPLQVVPGSHHSSTDQGVGVENRKIILAAAGEILAMRPLLTHSSGLSKPGTTQHRRILHLEFATGPLPEPLQWYEFHPVATDRCQASFN